MEDLASIDSFITYPVYGDSITNTILKDRMVVISDPGLNIQYLDTLSLIHEDLIDDEWVWLLMLNGGDLYRSNMQDTYPFLLDSTSVKLLDKFKFSNTDGLFDPSIQFLPHQIGLVDTKGTLRYIYDIRDKEELDLFISHLVLLVPKE
ncbi:MAG TPA: hypothetical protein VJ951_12320 [Bacteroidales bacterium]|nr:hypothetical protein [Bacteroidales bacterium]